MFHLPQLIENAPRTNLVSFRAEQKQVERNGGDHIDKEPALEVVDGDLTRVAHHLVVLIDVRRSEVYENVDDEHDVDDQVDDRQRVVEVSSERIVLPLFHLCVTSCRP